MIYLSLSVFQQGLALGTDQLGYSTSATGLHIYSVSILSTFLVNLHLSRLCGLGSWSTCSVDWSACWRLGILGVRMALTACWHHAGFLSGPLFHQIHIKRTSPVNSALWKYHVPIVLIMCTGTLILMTSHYQLHWYIN